MPIQNRITDLEAYKAQFPYPMIEGVFEFHVFLTPLFPSEQILSKYLAITNQINESRKGSGLNPIKPCHLALDYKQKGYVRVLQSSRYYTTNDIEDAIKKCNKEADLYQSMFDEALAKGEISEQVNVVRTKLECLASSHGVPKTNKEAEQYPSKYFEFHIRVRRKNPNNMKPVTEEELNELKELSIKFTEQFGVPVPLSYNNNNEMQRFFNLRCRNCGSEEALLKASKIVEAINASDNFVFEKQISEYVPYDDFTKMDISWID